MSLIEDTRRDEKRLLAEFAASRDDGLRERLVTAFAPLARSLARRYGSYDEFEDLEQVAMLGLVNALDRYSPERGRFSGFAAATILGELRHHLRDRVYAVRIPRQQQEMGQKIGHARAELSEKLAREPTVAELAERIGTTMEAVLDALEARTARDPSSLDVPLGDTDAGATVLDLVPCTEDGYARIEDNQAVAEAGLTGREARVLRLLYGAGMKQREVGHVMGVSQMQVSRINRKAIEKLLIAMAPEATPSL
jgi:RNA polymerase sigma-B factor